MVFANNLLAGAAAGLGGAGYTPAGAIWLGSTDYLSITPGNAQDDTTAWSLSMWLKINVTDTSRCVWSTPSSLTLGSLQSSGEGYQDKIRFYGTNLDIRTNAVYRDPTAWMNVVWVWDSANATQADRARIYVNGAEASVTGTENVSSSQATDFMNQSVVTELFRQTGGFNYYNGYVAEVIFLDGTASTDCSEFGKYDANGNWVPIDPSGLTFGINGFWLQFDDPAFATYGLGKDSSGNSNHFTPTSMSSANSTSDRPADKAADGLGNACVWNSLAENSGSWGTPTYANGNLNVTSSSGTIYGIGTEAVTTGKWYWRVEADAVEAQGYPSIGIQDVTVGTPYWDASGYLGGDTYSYVMITENTGSLGGKVRHNGSYSAVLFSGGYVAGDFVDIALDLDNGKLWFGKNGTWSGDPAAGTGAAYTGVAGTFAPACTTATSSRSIIDVFGGTAPTGFSYLHTANLPAPTVTKPDDYFNTVLYTGTSATLSVTGLDFQPDFVWIKTRSTGTTSHQIYDAVRGATKYVKTNYSGVELTYADTLTSFDSGGFSLGADASSNDCNFSGRTYVAWCLKAGGAGSSNTNGSITSTVSVAAHGGFSIITYTGTGANATVGHGLSKAPTFIMVKARNQAYSWGGWHDGLTPGDYVIRFDSSAAESNQTGLAWQSTPPSSTVITLGSQAGQNGSGDTHVCYAFARTPGLIGIGKYIGNGSTDGPYVVVDDGGSGFRPAWTLIKCSSSAGSNWIIQDGTRAAYNPLSVAMLADTTDQEVNTYYLDYTANGFKLRNTLNPHMNANGATYIYLAFAEFPFGGEGVAQAKAR